MPDLKDIILGNIAVERGLVAREDLLELQKQQRDTGLPLGQVMLRAGHVNGPKLIELMKLVSLTIDHLDGGLEVGADSADASGPPPLLVGAANEPTKPPRGRDEIPVVPVVGGGAPRPPAPRTGVTPSAPAAAARPGVPTPKPMPAPGPADQGVGTKTPAPLPSPFEQTPRPSPPAARPQTGRFSPRPTAQPPMQPSRPKTEAFNLEKPAAPPPKPKTEYVAGSAAASAKPATDRWAPAKSGSQVPKPKTERFEAARAGGRTPSEAFRVELAERERKSEAPQVAGAFGDASAVSQQKKDKTRLYTPVDIPKPTPAGKLPPEEIDGQSKDDRISVPPGARERLAGMSEGALTPAGKLPSGIDAESKPLVSPLDDVSVIPDRAPAFEMPPGAAAEMPPPKGRPSRPPAAASGKISRAPGSGPIPTAAAEGAHRMLKPDDSGFIAESQLPDFEVRASDKPGGKPVVTKNPKQPEPPKKETRKLTPGKGPVRPAMKAAGAKSPASTEDSTSGAKKEGEEEPKKRSKKFLVFLLIVLALVLGAGGALFYLEKLSIDDFKRLKDGFKQIPDTLKDAEYWKKLFLPK